MLLAWLPLLPLISFILLVCFSKKLNWLSATVLSVGSVGLSAVFGIIEVASLSASNDFKSVTIWQWLTLGEAHVNFSFYLDSLSAVMVMVVTGVGFLIHAYAASYMKTDKNYCRFMAYMNLFIVAMLILVLADNLVLLYLGWEGVGLCSFLLIGFWYQEPANKLAARKAFIVTRVGDVSLAIAIFLIFQQLSTVNFIDISLLAEQTWQVSDKWPAIIALLILGGAVGKSAQLPLHTWLPDAMAGPTPVSALIHAATMVTAGVYLIARMHSVFLLSPLVMTIVASIGAATLLLAGLTALKQTDIKRVLAYSTMSQIGYMMLALGAGAWSEAVFHLMTHAFFKALLFLTAGSIILALHHQQNLLKMGGLLKKMPIEAGFFIIGLLCLIAFPATSGFMSKEAILAKVWQSETAGPIFWWLGILGALLTSLYSMRLFMLAFLGKSRSAQIEAIDGQQMMRSALFVLALLSIIGGFIILPTTSFFPEINGDNALPALLHALAISIPFIGIVIAWQLYKHTLNSEQDIIEKHGELSRFIKSGLGFDWLYDQLLVKPYCYLARINRRDIFDRILNQLVLFITLTHEALSSMHSGHLRWYSASIVLATLLLLGVILL